MKHKIITRTQKNVAQLLKKKQQKKNLARLKKARYMREDYAKRKKRLNLTLDPDQFQQVKKEAHAVGIPPTAFVRESVLAYMKKERIPTQKVEHTLCELIFLMRNMSNNFNQIARQANTVQKLFLKDFTQTKRLLIQLENKAEDFIKRF